MQLDSSPNAFRKMFHLASSHEIPEKTADFNFRVAMRQIDVREEIHLSPPSRWKPLLTAVSDITYKDAVLLDIRNLFSSLTKGTL